MKKDARGTTFYCFSPPIMIATCIIETVLFAYTIFRYKMSTLTRIVAASLLCLAIFQAAEFNVCEGSGTPAAAAWSRVGFVAITMLPPLGMHLIRIISGKNAVRPFVWLAYISGIAFAAIFGLGTSTFQGHICAGNYAIFQLIHPIGGTYFAYYYTWLVLGICISLYYAMSAAKKIREALILQAIGYLCFLIPTGIVNDLNPRTINGIPSVMCGFAVLYALILTFGIIPRVLHRKQPSK